MRRADVKVGGHYWASINGATVPVTVKKFMPAKASQGLKVKAVTPEGEELMVSLLRLKRVATEAEVKDWKDKFEVELSREKKKLVESAAPRGLKALKCAGCGRFKSNCECKKEGEKSLPPSPSPATSGVKSRPSTVETRPVSTTGSLTTPAQPAPTTKEPSLLGGLKVSADNAPHVEVVARAGSGKTFTLIVGIVWVVAQRVQGLWQQFCNRLGFEPVPSPQQAEVWKSMALSKDAKTIQFAAFNKSIVREFEHKWGWVVQMLATHGVVLQFNTMHSIGNRAVCATYGRLQLNEYRVDDIVQELLGQPMDVLRKDKMPVLRLVRELVGLCKNNLVRGEEDELDIIVSHFGLELGEEDGDPEKYKDEVYNLVPRVLERCKDVTKDLKMDFDDMVWLPVVLNLPIMATDVLLGDEVQDWNRCQQALAKKAGRRLVLVGDPKQAIYGFAGADCESMDRMAKELRMTPKGCLELPLTVTRRCGHAIVAAANRYVPDLEAHESNPPGKVWHAPYLGPDVETPPKDGKKPEPASYRAHAKDGDFVLCRVNAPLVSQCFKFLKMGRKATIQGRDIGKGLIQTVQKLAKKHGDTCTVDQFVQELQSWREAEEEKEMRKKYPNEAKLIAIGDRYECLVCFADGAATVQEILNRIDQIFTDNRDNPGIRLSTVHKAKGLESKRVFILIPKGAEMPHPMARTAWAREQELNCLYIAITRAIDELIWVS